ncbi:MAG: NUDIX domain-containing protein [Candidatus Peregrinibacteria bacterium]|nr:NUDIX domain-containing protein [Candidatus Peregrinibacteria bacterium]
MEYFDLYDKNGKQLNQTKLRAEVHKDGDWHMAVDIWILNSRGELLLQKRAKKKESFPGLWEVSCSGHISEGEDSKTSAIRELKEELGLDTEERGLKLLFKVKDSCVTNKGKFVNNEHKDVYLMKKDMEIKDLKLDPEEVSEVKFMQVAELKQHIEANDKTFVPHEESYKKLFDYMETYGTKK